MGGVISWPRIERCFLLDSCFAYECFFYPFDFYFSYSDQSEGHLHWFYVIFSAQVF